ncbi:MAG: methyltransferase domain-containing protein [Planctomycetota bacterium]
MPRAVHLSEYMDEPDVDRDDLARSLVYIRAVNKRLGGVSAILDRFRKWSKRWPTDRPVTMIDLGTGSADLPVEAVAWASASGFDLRVTAVDNHAMTLDFARAHVTETLGEEALHDGRITLVQGDATTITDRFEPGSFDYAHAGLFLHHLNDLGVMTVLRVMDRLARAGVIWNDLVRTPIGRAAIRLMTLGQPEIIRHDAVVSVDKGFTRRETLDLAKRVDITYAEYSWNVLHHRFVLAGEKRESWS